MQSILYTYVYVYYSLIHIQCTSITSLQIHVYDHSLTELQETLCNTQKACGVKLYTERLHTFGKKHIVVAYQQRKMLKYQHKYKTLKDKRAQRRIFKKML